ncbi:MAG: acyl-CoA dehydrogenase [Rhodobacteraceae bacterium HLUCCA12]|nr:MAG: acyl-CoA dehydrogenase [Rhodobacteraceae bacterium HLUCCA12]
MTFRRDHVTRRIFSWARAALPSLSDTESEAIAVGDVHFEGELFAGRPDWSKLRAVPAPELTREEQAFIDGPCRALCNMLDGWDIDRHTADLPPQAWQHMRAHGFFGMIIPKEHGGLGFSAHAHSEVVRYISSHSVVGAVTVMVPNSLGPGELILQFGTDQQKRHWLPRLASGKELPAFGLTSEEAGSDASAMVDDGVVCKGMWQGEEVTGIRLNWAKRYITLAPVCTVLGLAFKLRDPDGLLGDTTEIGITCALVPTDLPGVDIGRRHLPSGTMFMNGPTEGKDVFIPLDHIIGGPDYAGRGWMMLMSALAAGRGISLPSLSAAAAALSAHTTGAYARIRTQFGLPIGLFGGVQKPIARIAANAYAIDAGRRLTTAALDQGSKLAVVSAIMKHHATERMRDSVNDAMDVHSGKSVIDGPLNYLQPVYRAIPIGITVEGANIVTRNLIIFGQGAIRAHPYLLKEMQALQEDDHDKALTEFDRHFWAHVGHSTRTVFRAFGAALTGRGHAPADAGKIRDLYARLSRWSSAFAVTADLALLTLGGALKRKEMISARLGDALSEMFLVAATLKRWEDDGRPEADLPLVRYVAETSFRDIGRALDETIANLPAAWARVILRLVVRPGSHARGPSHDLTEAVAMLTYHPCETRDRLIGALHPGAPDSGLGLLERAWRLAIAVEPIRKRLRDLGKSADAARHAGVLSDADSAQLSEAEEAARRVIAVDDYTPEALQRLFPGSAPPETDPGKEAAE